MPEARGGDERSYPTPQARGQGNRREELPHTPTPEAMGGGREEQPTPEARGCDERSYSMSKVRGGSREELPRVRGQGWRLGGATLRPGSNGCAGAGGPRGAIPH